MAATAAAAAWLDSIASGVSRTRAPPRATAATSAGVSPRPSSWTVPVPAAPAGDDCATPPTAAIGSPAARQLEWAQLVGVGDRLPVQHSVRGDAVLAEPPQRRGVGVDRRRAGLAAGQPV